MKFFDRSSGLGDGLPLARSFVGTRGVWTALRIAFYLRLDAYPIPDLLAPVVARERERAPNFFSCGFKLGPDLGRPNFALLRTQDLFWTC